MDFGKCQDRFGKFSWSKSDSNYLNVKFNVFKKDDNKHFRVVQSQTTEEADFNEIMRLGNRLVSAAANIEREGNLSTVMIPTMSEDMDEELNLAQR